MIPTLDIMIQEITEVTYSSRTYRIVYRAKENTLNQGVLALTVTAEADEQDRVSGYTDGLDAVAQAVYLILNTERYKFIIYSWDYGVELVDLFGKPMPYVISELPRRIKEALTMDERISDVVDFEFEPVGKRLNISFKVVSDIGNISVAMEVAI